MSEPRIRWDPTETKRLDDALLYILQHEGGWTAFSQRELFVKMQHVLEPHRRRAGLDGAASTYMLKAKARFLQRGVKVNGAFTNPHAVDPPPPSANGGDAAQALFEASQAQVTNDGQPVVVQIVSDQLMETLIDAGVDLLTGVLTHPAVRKAARDLAQAALLREDAAAEASADNDWAPSAVAKGPKVLVAGYNRDKEVADVLKWADNRWRLRFWTADESKRQLKQLAGEADVVVMMVSWCGHSAYQIAKARAKRFVHVTGHVAEMKAALEKIR